MSTNPKRCIDGEAAKTRLAAAKNEIESVSQLFESAAKTAGLARLAATQLGSALGNTLIDSSSKTMELAEAQLREAEKKSMSLKQKWGGKWDGRTALPKFTRRKKRALGGYDEHFNDNSDNMNNYGGKKCPVPKKSKIDKIFFATSTFSPTPGFSFGAVPSALPAQPFAFGSNSTNVTTTSSSAPVAPFASNSLPPVGKRKLHDENSTGDVTRASKAVLESRKIVKASRNWRKDRSEATNGVKTASIFASVKHAPSTTTESKKKREINNSVAPSASVSAAASSFADKIAKEASNTHKGTSNTGNADGIKQEKNEEEETLYKVRAKHFKRVKNRWEKCSVGALRLYRHNQTSKYRMVMHNESTGQVQFNVQISKGMLFNKVAKESDKGMSTYVKFGAVEDASKGVESFMLQVKPEFVDDVIETLKRMAEKK